MSFSKLHLNQRLFVAINNLLVFFWLDIRMLFQYNPFKLVDFCGTDPVFKCSPQVFSISIWTSTNENQSMMLSPQCLTIWFQSLNFTPPKTPLVIVAK